MKSATQRCRPPGFTAARAAHARSAGLRLRALCAALTMFGAWAPGASGAPEGGVVRAGSASIAQSGARTDIVQDSARAVIDWRGFSIGAGEQVNFHQPSATAATLNRVTGEQVSRLEGQLRANGQVLLVNPNGIVFGAGARVDVGSLIATTSNIGDANFMAGRLEFDQPGRAGAGIAQAGTITAAQSGLVALVAPHVRNDGLIQARLGRVVLASADTYTIDLAGDGLVSFALSERHLGQLHTADGAPLRALIDQAGAIDIPGGQAVLVAAATAREVLGSVIDLSGVIQADSAAVDAHGRIVLAAAGGQARVTGQLLARGAAGATAGGTITVGAGELVLGETALLDATGAGAAGTVALAGIASIDAPAASAISRSLRTGSNVAVESARGLNVDATVDGRGGRAGGALVLAAQDELILRRDVITADGAIDLVSRGGSLTMEPQPVPIDGARQTPIVFSGSAPIRVGALRSAFVFELITSGDVLVEVGNGPVFLSAQQGFALDMPLGSLTVRALSSDQQSMGDVTMTDVRVRPGGFIDVEAHRNVSVVLEEDPVGLLEAADAGGLSLRSQIMGELFGQDVFLGNPGARYVGPGSDGDWTTLADNPFDSVSGTDPGITPPSPTGAVAGSMSLAEVIPADLGAPARPLALPQLPPSSAPVLPEAAPPVATTPPSAVEKPAVQTDGVAAVQAQRAADQSAETAAGALASGAASGGRGVAQDADLGRTTGPLARANGDVFEQPSHVVEGPACGGGQGGSGSYFASDAFGQSVVASCD